MKKICPICEGQLFRLDLLHGRFNLECDICKKFVMSEELFYDWQTHKTKYKNKINILKGNIRWAYERDLPVKLIESEDIGRLIIEEPINVIDKQNKLMNYFELICSKEHPAANIYISPSSDYPITYSVNKDEFTYYLINLLDMGFINIHWHGRKLSNEEIQKQFLHFYVNLTHKGWEYLIELKKTPSESEKAFVAMWFPERKVEPEKEKLLSKVYKEAIEPAIKEAGYRPILLLDVHRDEKICDIIEAEIKESRFLIADVTGERPNVYFEAGYAKSLKIPVIWLCDDKTNMHFDTRQYSHIIWKPNDLGKLKKELFDRIRGVVGPGPLKKGVT